VPLNETAGWSFELNKFEQAITPKTKAIFYCNPNNPTGTIYSKEQLLGLAELAKKHNLYLISDEVYKDIIFDKPDKHIFSLAEIPELRKLIIRIFSFSKSHSMTGWRIGYIHSDESIISEILKTHDSLVTCAPVISQYGALGALEMVKSDLDKYVTEYQNRRDLICARLDKLDKIFSYIKPQGAYFVFPKIRSGVVEKYFTQTNTTTENKNSLSWQFTTGLLKSIQVALVPGIAFGPNGEDHVRMSFGRSEQDINRAFDRMDKFFI
jgi:aminotransferase